MKAVDYPGVKQSPRTKFIVISGSVRFLEYFKEQYVRIACEGNIPFTVAGNIKDKPEYPAVKPYLDKMYQEVITRYADELFVLDIDGYIGESTLAEIVCAEDKGIPVRYYSEEPHTHDYLPR